MRREPVRHASQSGNPPNETQGRSNLAVTVLLAKPQFKQVRDVYALGSNLAVTVLSAKSQFKQVGDVYALGSNLAMTVLLAKPQFKQVGDVYALGIQWWMSFTAQGTLIKSMKATG
jgi:hypothetical protein